MTTNNLDKKLEPRTTQTTRTRASSSFTAFGSHPGGEGKPSPWTLPRTALNLQGTLPFLFAIFAHFAVKITADIPFSGGKGELSLRGKSSGDTPFFVRDFRAFRG